MVVLLMNIQLMEGLGTNTGPQLSINVSVQEQGLHNVFCEG
jgi:hypothetical protein